MNKKGFTLIELMIVIALIGILSCLSYPRLLRVINSQRLTSGIQSIHSALLFAKLSAIKEKKIISVVFNIGQGVTGTYSVFVDNGPTGTNSGNGIINTADGEKILKTGHMPKGVSLYNIGLNGNLNSGNSIAFNQMGFPTLNKGGTPAFYDGAIFALVNLEPTIPYFKRVVINKGGNLIIEKSADGSIFHE